MENIEEKLLEEKWLVPWQLDQAKIDANNSGKSLWVSLVKLGFLSEENIILFLAQESGVPYVKVGNYAINQAVLHLVEENFSLQNKVIPLFKIKDTLFVACCNPLDTGLLDSLAKMTGCIIEPLLAEAHAILGALDMYWRLEENNFELAKFIVKRNAVQGFSQWRVSPRVALKLPFELKVLDETVTLLNRQPITGSTFDISSDILALGIQSPVFLPAGLLVLISLKTNYEDVPGGLIELRAEIVRSTMIKPGQYFLGLKLMNVSEAVKKELLRLVPLN